MRAGRFFNLLLALLLTLSLPNCARVMKGGKVVRSENPSRD